MGGSGAGERLWGRWPRLRGEHRRCESCRTPSTPWLPACLLHPLAWATWGRRRGTRGSPSSHCLILSAFSSSSFSGFRKRGPEPVPLGCCERVAVSQAYRYSALAARCEAPYLLVLDYRDHPGVYEGLYPLYRLLPAPEPTRHVERLCESEPRSVYPGFAGYYGVYECCGGLAPG